MARIPPYLSGFHDRNSSLHIWMTMKTMHAASGIWWFVLLFVNNSSCGFCKYLQLPFPNKNSDFDSPTWCGRFVKQGDGTRMSIFMSTRMCLTISRVEWENWSDMFGDFLVKWNRSVYSKRQCPNQLSSQSVRREEITTKRLITYRKIVGRPPWFCFLVTKRIYSQGLVYFGHAPKSLEMKLKSWTKLLCKSCCAPCKCSSLHSHST